MCRPMSQGPLLSEQPPGQFPDPIIAVRNIVTLHRERTCRYTDHLTRSNNTQRLDLGSRGRGSAAEGPRSDGGASLADGAE